jgi:metallo-beta-lactamase family protein
MKLTFCGAAEEVTGSSYLLEADGKKVLVDCGLHQGTHYAEERNFEPFPFDPKSLAAVFVTHAHIDHIGRLPKLVKDGFRGKVFSTPPTRDFAELLLLDSEHLLAKDAQERGLEPLYDAEDVKHLMRLWHETEYHQKISVGDVHGELWNAGHILGSAIVRLEAEGKSVVFTGDLGNYPPSIIQTTEFVPKADYVLIDTTYGDRVHEGVAQREEQLGKAVVDAVRLGGVVMIPAFAMERTQDLLYYFNDLVAKRHIPRVPVFIDSPLAIKLTAVYKKYENYFERGAASRVRSGDDIFNFPGLHLTLSKEQSKEINQVAGPKIIIAGSGMSNGGRILHHEKRYLPDPKSTIIFVGYQAVGTLGRQILEGADTIRILQDDVPVRCERKELTGYSAHADQPRLLNWLSKVQGIKKVFAIHGEPQSSHAFADKVRTELRLAAAVPKNGETIVL